MKDIDSAQFMQLLMQQNPWWNTGELRAPFLNFQPRLYLDALYYHVTQSDSNRAVVLLGPRRAGKTVLLMHVVGRLLRDGVPKERIFYLSADHPLLANTTPDDMLRLYKECFQSTGVQMPLYFFIDETQYIKDWERHLKFLVDWNQECRFVVSGSAAAALRMKSLESGAGRFRDFFLPPLNYHEYLELKNIDTGDVETANRHFLDYINRGGFPEVSLDRTSSNLKEFIETDVIDKVLLRDLPSLYGIRDVQELKRLFNMLAFNTSGELSMDPLSKHSGVSKETIRSYIEYLEAAFLVKLVMRVDRTGRYFRRAHFSKAFVTNASLYTALFGEVKEEDANAGALVETAVCGQVLHDRACNISYARWANGEVDLVDADALGNVTTACEVKWSDRFFEHPHELSRLTDFCHVNNLPQALVTTKTQRGVKRYKNVDFLFVPAGELCAELGKALLERESFKQSPIGLVQAKLHESLR